MASMSRSIRRNYARKKGTFIPQKPLRERGSRSFLSIIIDNMKLKRKLKETLKAS